MSRTPGSLLDREDLREQLVDQLTVLVSDGNLELAAARIELFHPADQAEVLEELPDEIRDKLLVQLSDEHIAEILDYLDEEPRARFVSHLDGKILARILVFVDDELAADIVEELPDEKVEEVLSRLDNREAVSELLSLPDDCVGRWMSQDILTMQDDWTIEQAFSYLRREKPDSARHFYLYVVDANKKLKGVVSIRTFITADPEAHLADIMTTDVIRLLVTTDQEAAAAKMRHYNLVALPVVDDEGHLEGVLTADDVLDVQVEEATEDIYLQVGLNAEADVLAPIAEALRQRVPWLLVNLVIGFMSALIVKSFEGTIAQVALLAAFMPIIAGHGGNTGCQTATLVVRSIALGEVYRRDVGRIIAKELTFGIIYGLLAGSLTGLLAFWLDGWNPWMGGVVFLAMVGNVALAALGGSLIPLALRALNIDPALASTVWLTTFTDWVGFLLLLGMGTVLVQRLT